MPGGPDDAYDPAKDKIDKLKMPAFRTRQAVVGGGKQWWLVVHLSHV